MTKTLKEAPELNFWSSRKPLKSNVRNGLSNTGLRAFAFFRRTAVTVLDQRLVVLPPPPRRRGRPPKGCGLVHSRPPPAPLCYPHITPGHCAASLAPGWRGCGPIPPIRPVARGCAWGPWGPTRRVGAAHARGGRHPHGPGASGLRRCAHGGRRDRFGAGAPAGRGVRVGGAGISRRGVARRRPFFLPSTGMGSVRHPTNFQGQGRAGSRPHFAFVCSDPAFGWVDRTIASGAR